MDTFDKDGNLFMKILIACGITFEQLRDYVWEIEYQAPGKYRCIGNHPTAKRIDIVKDDVMIR